MNVSEIKELLELFEAGSIRELDLKQENIALYLNKNEMNRAIPTVKSVDQQLNPQQEILPNIPPVETAALVEEPVEVKGETVNSPIVGVVYTSSEPQAPAFMKVGDKVSVGDTICIIEAMKIMNEVKSDKAGTITEILINNEDVVEFSQPLVRIV